MEADPSCHPVAAARIGVGDERSYTDLARGNVREDGRLVGSGSVTVRDSSQLSPADAWDNSYLRRLVLVPTAASDIPRIVRLETRDDTVGWLGLTGRDWHVAALADETQLHLSAWQHGRPIAFVVLCNLVRESNRVELRRLVVSSDNRGRGVGREMLIRAIAVASALAPAATVWLDVKRTNSRACHLYESVGFRAASAECQPAERSLVVLELPARGSDIEARR